MPKAFVRLYDSIENESTLVSFDCRIRAVPELAREALDTFLEENQRMHRTEAPSHLGHIDAEFYTISLPLPDERVRQFARICLSHINTDDSVVFVDNREMVPERNLQEAGTAIAWV